jgi:RNA polymerase sigma-70 factor (ECF subfamily)
MELANRIPEAQPVDMASSTEIAELYETHYAAVYRTAIRITGNPTDAEDAVHTVFLRILKQQGGWSFGRMPEAYFRRAAANAAIDLLRRRMADKIIQIDDASSFAARETTALLKEQLRRALTALERIDSVLFLLRYVEGLSNGELAELFGLEKNNVAVRLHRIRQTLQAEMKR